MAVRNEHGQFPKFRLHADAAISIRRTPDFNASSVCIIRYDFSLRELKKAGSESFHRICGHVNTVFRDHLESRIGRRDRVPVELRVHPTRPLDGHTWSRRLGETT